MNFIEKNNLKNQLMEQIRYYSDNIVFLPGIESDVRLDVFAKQLIDSINRVNYFNTLSQRPLSSKRIDPSSNLFDPIRAIIYLKDKNYDEACWLAFLLIHFGENYQSNWSFIRSFYSNNNGVFNLGWNQISQNPALIDIWIANINTNGLRLKFGNHRKYESLSHLRQVIESYIAWVYQNGGHTGLFRPTGSITDEQLFQQLYATMPLFRFGRLAKFDYLSILYKTGLANIKADSCHLRGSTGPLKGAKLLFGRNIKPVQLDQIAMALAQHLNIGYQEMEDALCNWQKSPDQYTYYTG